MTGNKRLSEQWKALAELSGFPEPFLSGKLTTYRRWSGIYSRQLIREDILDLTGIKTISDIEMLYTLLPSRVGSPVSVTALSEDIKVSYNTASSWLLVFEKFFLTFSISPWAKNIKRAIHKERKLYLYDVPRIKDDAARFENMVALELYRDVIPWNDMGYGFFSLHYVKNKEKEEIDFLIANDNEPFLPIETELSDTEPSPVLKKFQGMLNIPALQLLSGGNTYKLIPNGANRILVAPAFQWCAGLA